MCVRASMCVRSTHGRCVRTSPIYCSFAGDMLIERADRWRPMSPRYLASRLPRKFDCPAKINRRLGVESLSNFCKLCSWIRRDMYINLTRRIIFCFGNKLENIHSTRLETSCVNTLSNFFPTIKFIFINVRTLLKCAY